MIAQMLEQRLGGYSSTESRILTDEGVKAADAVWCHPSRWNEVSYEDVFLKAPEVCIGVLWPGNMRIELEHKRALYFAAGAHEVWFCDGDNNISFFNPEGLLEKSNICPAFPSKIDTKPPA